jgi:hypothetical protein
LQKEWKNKDAQEPYAASAGKTTSPTVTSVAHTIGHLIIPTGDATP